MQTIDFSKVPKIHTKLSPQEISHLNELFATPEVQKDLEDIEAQRKIRQKWYIGTGVIFTILMTGISFFVGLMIGTEGVISKIFSGLFYTVGIGDNSISLFEGGIILGFFIFGAIYSKFRSKIEIPLKRDILSKMCAFLDPKLEYSYDAKFSFDDLSKLKEKQFIKNYTILDLVEDSTSLHKLEDGKGFYMRGFELETSTMSGSGKNRKKVITNHDYITKLVFPKARISLQSDIYVKSKNDTNDLMGVGRIIGWVIGFIMGSMILFLLFSVLNENSSVGLIFIGIFVVVPIITAGLFFLFKKSQITTNKILLEDVDFNKKYDVYCDDEIGSRMILTPAFMQRILDFTTKTGQNYSFMFSQNTVYIKRQINGKYLEVGTGRDIFKNVQGFVQFFVDMREVLLLSKDLNFLYLSKTDVNLFNTNQEIVVSETPINFSPENKSSFLSKLFGFGKKTTMVPVKL